MSLQAVIYNLKYFSYDRDEDVCDHLHAFFTTNILLSLAVLISFKQFGGKPIECLVPDMFGKPWEQVTVDGMMRMVNVIIFCFSYSIPKITAGLKILIKYRSMKTCPIHQCGIRKNVVSVIISGSRSFF